MGILNITEWDVISKEKFASMAFDSGVIIKNFNPSTFTKPSAGDILCVTQDNIAHNFAPTIVNLADGVNNIHILPKETVIVTGYENPTITFTALDCTPEMLKFLAGFATKNGAQVTPAMVVDVENDFTDLALVMRRVGGGFVAVALSNAISTGGISVTTSKGSRSTFSVTITGFGSIDNPSKIPVDYYAIPALAVQLDKHEVTVAVGSTVALTADTYPGTQTVTWSSDNTDEANVSNGTVTGVAIGTVTVTASITVSGETATDKCLVHVVSAGA